MPNITETTDAAATTGTTYILGIGQTAQGSITAGDSDWYRVSLVAGQTYTFALVGTSANALEDPYLVLRNSAGVELVNSDDDGPGRTSSITFTAVTSGVHYLAAGDYYPEGVGQYGLSATLGDRASYDEQMGAGILIRDAAFWSAPGVGATLTWAVQATYANVTDADNNATTGMALSAAQVTAVRASLSAFSEVGKLTFTQVNPGGTSNNATMLFSAYDSDADGAGAYAYFPGSTASSALAGDVRLNNDSISTTSIPQGGYAYWAIMHEIGHAMGLAHPGDYNAAPGLSITYAADAQFTQDSAQYTIMSYFDAAETTDNPQSNPDTLLLFDILAIQQVYGANMATRSGASIYGFGANTGSTYDFAINTRPALCIWDGGGIDLIDASGFTMAQVIDLRAGGFSSIGGIAGNVSIAFGAVIENATGGSGADTLIGNSAANILKGGTGADRMEGGSGSDTYYVDNVGDKVLEAKVKGTDLIYSSVTYSLAGQYVENLTLTGSASLKATGNTLANILTGNSGANVLDGGKGADTMVGGKGSDTYYFDDVGDKVIEAKETGTDLIYSSVTYSLAGQYVEKLTLTGSANLNATGNTLDNTIIGNSGANVLNGGKGADSLTGGSGSDTYYVDNLGDRVIEADVTGVDHIYSSVTYSLAGQYVEKLTLTGSANLNATGNTLANTITGNSGANVIDGGARNDRIQGMGGADILTGGTGSDVFVYGATAESTVSVFDRITDLSSSDRIDLSAIDANTKVSGNQAFSIVDAFTKTAGQMTLDYSSSTKLTTILMDVNGDGVADMKIVANGNHEAFNNFVF